MTSDAEGLAPARVLGPLSATCVVIGAIIGVGIFFTPQKVAADAGTPGLALLAWSLGGVLAALGALTFAELGGLETGPGAQYRVLRDAFGRLPGFLYGFCNLTAIQAGATAIIGVITVNNLGTFLNVEFSERWTGLLAIAMILFLTLANIAGVKWGARIQNVTVFAKVATLLAITAMAMTVGEPATSFVVTAPKPPPTAAVGPVAAVFGALLPVLFTFGGWQQALWISGEVKNPKRTLPFAILTGVAVVIVTYEAVNWAYFRLLGYDNVSTSSALAADSVGSVLGATGGRAVAFAVAFSAFGVMNAQLLSGPRFIFAMAEDRNFFAPFARLHPRFGTPTVSIAVLGGLAILLLLPSGTGHIDRILDGVVFVDWVFFALTGAALMRLRTTRPEAERPFKVPLYPFIPLLFIAMAVAVVVATFFVSAAKREAAFGGVAFIVVAALLHRAFFHRR